MTTHNLQQQIIESTKELPKESLLDVLQYIRTLKTKNQLHEPTDNLTQILSELDQAELGHLEQEVQDYKELYPRE